MRNDASYLNANVLPFRSMEPLIMFIWLLLIAGVPLALIVATFIAFRSKIDPFRIIAGVPLGLTFHIICSYFSLFPMFVMAMSGAHMDPPVMP